MTSFLHFVGGELHGDYLVDEWVELLRAGELPPVVYSVDCRPVVGERPANPTGEYWLLRVTDDASVLVSSSACRGAAPQITPAVVASLLASLDMKAEHIDDLETERIARGGI